MRRFLDRIRAWFDPRRQLEKLEADVEDARRSGIPVDDLEHQLAELRKRLTELNRE